MSRGIAIGKFRQDGGRTLESLSIDRDKHEKGKGKAAETLATAARQAMIEREENGGVAEMLGGNEAAANQAKEYTKVLNQIKNGQTHHTKGTAAEKARQAMIDRDEADNARSKAHKRT